ncbi:MAG: hypothetical protein ACKOBW_08905 [Planctomycetota bacterium]
MSSDEQLIPRRWYWVRRSDGSLAPYVFHRLRYEEAPAVWVAEFFVGSFIQTFRLNQVVGECRMPKTTPESSGSSP